MNLITRGIRNALRNITRTLSITLILGLSIGLAIAMLLARQGVSNKIESVKSSIGNTITISPAGARGFEGGGEALTSDQLDKVKSTANVVAVNEMLNDRLTSDNSSLVSAIDAGSLGRRQAGNSGINIAPDSNGPSFSQNDEGSGRVTRTFTPPVEVTGTDQLSSSVYGADQVNFVSGEPFDPTKDENVALVGKSLAEKNKLDVGSTFKAYDSSIKVVGIYDTGNTFSNGGLVMPLATVQRLSDQSNNITSATVTVNSVDNLDGVVNSIKQVLGSAADVTSSQEEAKQAIEPLESVRTISLFSLIAAVIAGAVIILLAMMMIVRERRREIGVMKAIGSSNIRTTLQFISEAVTLTCLGLVAGIIIGIAAANPVTKTLVNNNSSQSTTNNAQEGPGFQQGPGQRRSATVSFSRGIRGVGSNSLNNLKSVQVSTGWNTIAYGIGAAILIAVVGSAIPAYMISKIRPAEVMRAD